MAEAPPSALASALEHGRLYTCLGLLSEAMYQFTPIRNCKNIRNLQACAFGPGVSPYYWGDVPNVESCSPCWARVREPRPAGSRPWDKMIPEWRNAAIAALLWQRLFNSRTARTARTEPLVH